MNFWEKLPKPFVVVAPMADVTDAPFRRMIAKYSAHTRSDGTFGGPDVMWTEFVSADGLIRATPEGKVKLMADLIYSEEERPIVAQLFSSNPAHMEQASALCFELGFDGIDINMGCPDKSIEKQGCGSAMIKTPEVARDIIAAAKLGAQGIPVSVKTRLGYHKDELETWLPHLLSCEPAAITIHARTRKEMSKVPARWDRVKRGVEIRDAFGVATRILGNGDALSLEDAYDKAEESGADGIMVGRVLFGNPWFFNPQKQLPHSLVALPTKGVDREKLVTKNRGAEGVEFISLEERLSVMLEHTKLFEELLPHKNFAVMKKHFKAYVNGFEGASTLRGELMVVDNSHMMETILAEFLRTQSLYIQN
jgi:nifR3 family TIM-barrel protein